MHPLPFNYNLIDTRQIPSQQFKGRVSGVKVKPVDTTGAGDAFTGAILYCLAADLNVLKVTAALIFLLRFLPELIC